MQHPGVLPAQGPQLVSPGCFTIVTRSYHMSDSTGDSNTSLQRRAWCP